MNGTGTMSYPNGDVYNGGWERDKRDSKNSKINCILSNGSVILHQGEWKNDVPVVHGTYKYKNGDVYTGWHNKGFKEGDGVMIYKNGDEYKGKWRDDKQSTGEIRNKI